MNYDVVIVGAGPAGLAAAIRLKQLAAERQQEISVCVLEKGAEVGAHILSGAVIDPIALDELIPEWRAMGAPLHTPVCEDRFLVLSGNGSWRIPNGLLPPLMKNDGNYIASLGRLCHWLGQQAEALGVEIYCGFTGAEVLYDDAGAVRGIVTGDMRVAKDGSHSANYTPGIELHAKYTLIAEGVRGSLAQQLEQRFKLRSDVEPQKYGIGIKELWRVDPSRHQPGLVLHSQGWPLDQATGGGSFLYHMEENLVAVGFVVHLNYQNPHLSPFDEFQRFKTHPAIRDFFIDGERLAYGARAINEGGLQSIPKLVFPGGALIGCSAGFVNVPRIKGSHNAMKSGMLAAESVVEALAQQRANDELSAYPQALLASWIQQDLYQVRNVKPALTKFGTVLGTLYGGVDMWLHSLGIKLPWTLKHGAPDHSTLKPASSSPALSYPKPDGVLTFDRLSSVYLSNTHHQENQPCHLQLKDAAVPITINLPRYDAPEQRYCPAGVYEIIWDAEQPRLQINGQNCVHCKVCDIKDLTQNIVWTVPEGGDGPNYVNM